MHLVVPTYHSIFWVVCHLSRTFPLKKFKQEPQNRLSLLPIARPYPLLSLTHNLPLQYWLGTSWWCLGLMRSLLLCMSKACLLLMRLPWTGGSCAFFRSFLTSYGVNCFMILHSLSLASSKGRALLDCGLFSLLAHYLLLSLACQYSAMPLCYFCCGAIWSMLVGPHSGLLYTLLSIGYNVPVWPLSLYSCYFRLSWSITLLVGSFGPFLSPWATSAHFLILHSHGLLPTLLGFSSLVTISFILRVHGHSINPLLS